MEKQNFKCICGYEYENELDLNSKTYDNLYKVIKGDKPFIRVSLLGSLNFEIENPREKDPYDYTYEEKTKVYLYACPKCKTLKMYSEELEVLEKC